MLEVKRHVQVGVGGFPYRIVPLENMPFHGDVVTTTMTSSEIFCRLGELLTLLGSARRSQAEAHFRAALNDSATRGVALAGIGFLRDLDHRSSVAESLYAEAFAATPNESRVCLLAGRGALFRTDSVDLFTDRTPGGLLAARTRFLCCLRSDPDNLEALAGFGHSFICDPDPPSAALAALRLVAGIQPARVDAMSDLLVLLSRSGRNAEADSVAQVLAPRLRGQWRGWILATSEYLRANRMRERGERNEALELLRHAAGTAPPGELRHTLETQIARWQLVDAK
jgi:hypothetical protein